MIALIQRVTEASVTINHVRTAEIEAGLLALIGVEQSDSEASAVRLAERVLRYRVFSDDAGRMNLDVLEAGLGVLAVPQFTLVADTQKGRRPGFSRAAPPDQASALFDHFADTLQPSLQHFGRGTFGANMAVSLVNDGPVTFWLQAD